MPREALPLLIALALPLAGMAGFFPPAARGTGDAQALPVVTPPADPPLLLPLPAPGPPFPVAGIWLNF